MIRSRRTRLAAALVAASLALVARDAEACKCSYGGNPMSGPQIHAAAPVLLEEAIELRCDRAPPYMIVCTWHARYRLDNPGDAAPYALTIRHVAGAAVRLAFDGVTVATSPAATMSVQRDAARRDVQADTGAVWHAPAAGTTTLTVDATFVVDKWGCCDASTNARRHRWVTGRANDEYFVTYVPASDFAPAPATYTLTHDIPATWRGGFPRGGAAYKKQGRRRVARLTRPRALNALDADHDISATRPWRFTPGGPLVGAGLGWSPEGLRVRLRAGWEVAWPKVLQHSLVVETDARRRVALVPAWEFAIPHWFETLPDVGAGIGVPIQLTPDPRVGVRAQGRFGVWIFQLIGSFDHFPAVRGLPRERLGALTLQVGF